MISIPLTHTPQRQSTHAQEEGVLRLELDTKSPSFDLPWCRKRERERGNQSKNKDVILSWRRQYATSENNISIIALSYEGERHILSKSRRTTKALKLFKGNRHQKTAGIEKD